MKNNRPKVVYWNNIPSPYMVDRFNALVRRDNLDFEAWFNARTEPDRSWRVIEKEWSFTYRYVPRFSIGGFDFRFPWPVLQCDRGTVLVSLYAEPVFVIGWIIARARKMPTAFWCEITFDSWVQRRWWKRIVKQWMFKRVDRTFGPGDDGRSFSIASGTHPSNAKILPHAIDVDFFIRESDNARATKGAFRKRIGISGVTFLYVGRMWTGKGLSDLLHAFINIQGKDIGPTCLIMVGDGDEEASLRRTVSHHNLENVFFCGFQHKNELPQWYAAADVFVFPTLGDPYGLVVDEAMACALPIISTDAAGEISDRITPGKNGLIVPAGSVTALASAMCQLARDPSSLPHMGLASRDMVAEKNPDQWAVCFEQRVLELLAERT